MNGLRGRQTPYAKYVHERFGYRVLTNLTESDLNLYFPSEVLLRAWFKQVGVAIEPDPKGSVTQITERVSEHPAQILSHSWQDDALCRSVEADFVDFTPPIEVLKVVYAKMDPESPTTQNLRAAQRICSDCPVSTQCLAKSIQDRGIAGVGETGIWAGTVEMQRRDALLLRRGGMKRGISILKTKIGIAQSSDTLICSRCWHLADEDGHHANIRFDSKCPGAVTAIRYEDFVKGIWPQLAAKSA